MVPCEKKMIINRKQFEIISINVECIRNYLQEGTRSTHSQAENKRQQRRRSPKILNPPKIEKDKENVSKKNKISDILKLEMKDVIYTCRHASIL